MKVSHIASLLVLMLLVGSASATAVSITIYGTNASNAQLNVTCYGCNNTISVQAWNTSYTKTIRVNSVNVSGDVLSFNISNVTAYQVQQLSVNGTAVNGYQAGANGMLNFTYTTNSSNKTYTLSPAVNSNGLNMTWARIWSSSSSQMNQTGIKLINTVYQNTNLTNRIITLGGTDVTGTQIIEAKVSNTNPPGATDVVAFAFWNTNKASISFIVPSNYYYIVTKPGAQLERWYEWT